MNAFKWHGSKSLLVPHLIAESPDVPHSHYFEPFGGSGAVILGKPLQAEQDKEDRNAK